MIIEHKGTTAICALDPEDVSGLEAAVQHLRWVLTLPNQTPEDLAGHRKRIELLEAALKAGEFVVTTPADGGEVMLDDTGWAVCGALYNHDSRSYTLWYDVLSPWTLPFEPRR